MEEKETLVTLIQLKKETALKLRTTFFTEFGDTYETVITRMIKKLEEKKE